MHEYILVEIGQKLRKIRKDKGLTVQVVAARAGVSKGLISRIENSRTIPSLPVLIAIVKGLEIELNSFFSDIDRSATEQIVVKKATDLHSKDESYKSNLSYFPIFDKNIPDSIFKSTLVELKPLGKQMPKSENGFSYHYILEGSIRYQIGEENYDLETGDSLYFDARLMHSFQNATVDLAKILVMNFISD